MTTQSWFKKHYESLKDHFEFRLEALIIELTEKISVNMKRKKITRSKLAQLLDVTPAAVSKILNGTSNFTLRTLLSIADTLELDLEIDFKEKKIITPSKVELAGTIDTFDSAYSALKISRGTGNALSSVPHQDFEKNEFDIDQDFEKNEFDIAA